MTAQENIDIIKAWLDAHNRQDMKALDYMDEDVEIVEVPTGVVYRGMEDMKRLAEMAYSRKGDKVLTHIFATDNRVCAEYTAYADAETPVSDAIKAQSLHGIDLAKVKATGGKFALQVCFVCEIRNGKIHRAREYWDAESMKRQFGMEDEDGTPVPATQGLTVKAIMEEMIPQTIRDDPGIIKDIDSACQFHISGPAGGDWYVDLRKPGGQIKPGVIPDAGCTISMSDGDFVNFYTGKLSSSRAFISGRVKIKGNMALASRLQKVLRQTPA